MNKLTSLSIDQMREGLLKQDFSAVELVQAHLDRIEETNSRFNSFLCICDKQALEEAATADQVLRKEKSASGVLTGIPVGIKDMLITKGIETTCASKILKGFIPPYEGTAIAKLKKAGAIVIGKTNMDEFAMGSSNENSAFGPVRNPWDETRVSGGSSGGSAVCVALGQAPISLGTDTGGSIRQPASLSGVYGLKPTYGRVSRYGAVAFASSLDQIGPFARNVFDLALTLQIISGFDEHDSTSMKEQVPDFHQELKLASNSGLAGLRVGIPKEYFVSGAQAEVLGSVRKALSVLESLGAELIEISLPHTQYALAVYYIIAAAEASSNLARYDGVRFGHRASGIESVQEMYAKSRAEGFGAEVKRRIMLGTYVLSAGYYDAYYLKAQQVRTLIINDFKSAFANSCDIIAAPVSPTTAFSLGERANNPLQMYLADVMTLPVSLAGLPGMSVPCGIDNQGLPIGLQLVAKPFKELDLLKTAQSFSETVQFNTSNFTQKSDKSS